MRATSIKLTNFGGFREFTANMDAPIVGLLGPNGAGKSTLLKALEFSFTGELGRVGEAMDTFVRQVMPGGMEEQPKTASVEMTFRKNGTSGEILRRFGGNPGRKLKWGNMEKPVTAAKEVDRLMAEIFQADKQAVANAIFLKQGELDKLLFGDQADRERLFMKLLLIGHFSSVEQAVDAQITKLTGLLGDNSAILDEMRGQHAAATEQYAKITKAAGVIIIPGGLKEAGQLADVLDAYDAAVLDYATLKTAADEQVTAVEQASTEMCAVTGIQRLGDTAKLRESLDTWLAAARGQISGSTKAAEALTATITAWERLSGIRTRKIQLTAERQNLERACETLRTQLTGYRDDLEIRIAEFEQLSKLKETQANAVEAEKRANSAVNAVEAAVEEAQAAVTKFSTEKAPLKTQLSEMCTMLQMQVDLLTKVVGTNTTKQCCALCEQPVQKQFTQEDLQIARAKLGTKQAEFAALNAEESTLNRALSQVRENMATAKSRLATAREQLADLRAAVQKIEATTAALDITWLKSQAEQKAAVQTQLNTLQPRSQELARQIANVEKEADAQQWAWLENVEKAYSLEAQKAQLETCRKHVDELNAQVGHPAIAKFQQAVSAADDKLAKLSAAAATVTKHATKRDELRAYFGEQDKAKWTAPQLRAWLDEIEKEKLKRSDLEGQARAIDAQMAQLSQRIRQLEDAATKQERIKLTLDEMRLLKRTFARQGLPATYMTYRFEQLVELAQGYLEQLGADFMVMSDIDTPISFLFKRLSDPGGAWLPQEKLSGGQRVRLTVAFLLAVQKLIIPEVGLLVLDEPSVHLDAEGVESLVDLFTNLAGILRNSDSQVIICDHHPALAKAMGTVIEVKAPKPFQPAVPPPVTGTPVAA